MRANRYKVFERILEKLQRPVSVLDVGGTPGCWKDRNTDNIALSVVNLLPYTSDRHQCLMGDATNLASLESKSFDFAFSNSVIEHVGDFEQQRRMANEIRRVGRGYFVQTPNYYFPLEPHFLFPGFQFLPLAFRAQMLSRFNLGWVKKAPDYPTALAEVRQIQLLTARRLRQLFPEAYLYREKVFGLTKSITAIYSPF